MRRIVSDQVVSSDVVHYDDKNLVIALVVPENEEPVGGVGIYLLQNIDTGSRWNFFNMFRAQLSLLDTSFGTPKEAVDKAISCGYNPLCFSEIPECLSWIYNQSGHYSPF